MSTYTFPADRGCCIPHAEYPTNQLLACVCPTKRSGFSYLTITQHYGKRQTRCVFGPVRVATSQAWSKLLSLHAKLCDPSGWPSDNVSVFHEHDELSKPAPSIACLKARLETGRAAR